MKNAGKLTAVLIAAFSLVLVFGALLTALAETGFTAFGPEKTPIPNTGKSTATPIMLPTKAVEPTKEVKPTTPLEKTSSPEKTEQTLKTTTPTKTVATKTTAATQSGECTQPIDWKEYKVKSGDTLFAISVMFQTDVATLKSGNCLTSNQIITGQKLWVPDNATLTPTKTKIPVVPTKTSPPNTPKPTFDGCYVLTLSHLGDGADATAAPANSVGCPAGKYKKGEKITLTASPDPSWEVGSWYGTDNDSSTALTNTVTMPANDHLAKPIYVPICYALSVSSDANGGDPVLDKTKSTGCTADTYIAGETITFSASPNTGYTVDTWTGTDSGTNVLTMPAAAASVSVTYKTIPCYTLTLDITSGAGSVPTASASTMGCSAGNYAEGEIINVTAAPTGAGIAQSWDVQPPATYTTTADPLVIKVTMGAGVSTVSVTYFP